MLSGWNFDNSYTRLPEALFVHQMPDPVARPGMVILNHGLALALGLSPGEGDEAFLAGNELPDGATPVAQAYAGHQFGHPNMLGDGRAVLVGEHIAPDGSRHDIQYKGSGRTPFSRSGDGRAGLAPMLREYLIGEAMHGAGIATTRCLGVATTGEPVMRETMQPGAVMVRVAASHIRVGTFQYAGGLFAAHGDRAPLEALFAHTLARHYPDIDPDGDRPALDLLAAMVERHAALVTDWMRVGFIHGVMNTDNMTLSGETIDYGPCAFMDAYDPQTVFSSIDRGGRYAFAAQPGIAQWNIARLAEALLPLIDEDARIAIERATEVIEGFTDVFQHKWLAMMRAKLGLSDAREEDEALVRDLLAWMQSAKADYTNLFLDIEEGLAEGSEDGLPDGAFYRAEAFREWHARWLKRLEDGGRDAALDLMRRTNPAVIPRNHMVEQALAAASDEPRDMAPFNDLLAVLADPYARHDANAAYRLPPSPEQAAGYRTFCGT